jgi:hypothetical protein
MDGQQISQQLGTRLDFVTDDRLWKVLNLALPPGQHILETPKDERDFGSWWRTPHKVGDLRHQGSPIWGARNFRLDRLGKNGKKLTGAKTESGTKVGVEQNQHGHDERVTKGIGVE